jgi:hypothetical protein
VKTYLEVVTAKRYSRVSFDNFKRVKKLLLGALCPKKTYFGETRRLKRRKSRKAQKDKFLISFDHFCDCFGYKSRKKKFKKQIRKRKEKRRIKVGSLLDVSSVLWDIGVEEPIFVQHSRRTSKK